MERVLLFAFLLLGVVTSTYAGGQDDRSACEIWCTSKFGHSVAECVLLAGKGKGPCYECGPFRASDNWQLRNGECGSDYCVRRRPNPKNTQFAPTTFRTSVVYYPTDTYADVYSTEEYSTESYPTEGYSTDVYPTEPYPTEAYPTEAYPTDPYATEEYYTEEYYTDEYPTE
ncbi:hypothetical protein GX50_07799, partial [[Emmonsia] crescens]